MEGEVAQQVVSIPANAAEHRQEVGGSTTDPVEGDADRGGTTLPPTNTTEAVNQQVSMQPAARIDWFVVFNSDRGTFKLQKQLPDSKSYQKQQQGASAETIQVTQDLAAASNAQPAEIDSSQQPNKQTPQEEGKQNITECQQEATETKQIEETIQPFVPLLPADTAQQPAHLGLRPHQAFFSAYQPEEESVTMVLHSPYAPDESYKISVLQPDSKFVEFEEFVQEQNKTLRETSPPSTEPVIYWQVFFMGSDFEIAQRQKYKSLEEVTRDIELEKKRLQELSRLGAVDLVVPADPVIDDHELQRRANSEKSPSDHEIQLVAPQVPSEKLNKTLNEEYEVEIVNRAYDTDSDEQAKEMKLVKVESELELVEGNRLLTSKLTKATVKSPVKQKQVDYLNSNKGANPNNQTKTEKIEEPAVPHQLSEEIPKADNSVLEGEYPNAPQGDKEISRRPQAGDLAAAPKPLEQVYQKYPAAEEQRTPDEKPIDTNNVRDVSNLEHEINTEEDAHKQAEPAAAPINDLLDQQPVAGDSSQPQDQPAQQTFNVGESPKSIGVAEPVPVGNVVSPQPLVEDVPKDGTDNNSQIDPSKRIEAQSPKASSDKNEENPQQSELNEPKLAPEASLEVDQQPPPTLPHIHIPLPATELQKATNIEQAPSNPASHRSKKSRSSRASSVRRKIKEFTFASNILSVKVESEEPVKPDVQPPSRSRKVDRVIRQLPEPIPNFEQFVESSPVKDESQGAHHNMLNNPEKEVQHHDDKKLVQTDGVSQIAKEQLKVNEQPASGEQSNRNLEPPNEHLITAQENIEQLPTLSNPTGAAENGIIHSMEQPSIQEFRKNIDTAAKEIVNRFNSVHVSAEPIQEPQATENPISRLSNNEDTEKQAMKMEINELKKTIQDIKRQFVEQQRKSRSSLLQKISPYNIETHQAHSPPIDHSVEVSRTESIVEYYQRNKQQVQYPEIADIHTDELHQQNDHSPNPSRLYWHSQKRKPADKIGKILHRKVSDRKLQSPVGRDKEEFRVRPFLSKISSHQEAAAFSRTNGFESELKKKTSKEELLHKININEHNFRRFVKTRSNIFNGEAKHSNQSALLAGTEKVDMTSFPQAPLVSDIKDLKESISLKALANPEQESSNILTAMSMPKGRTRQPLPADASFTEEKRQPHPNNEPYQTTMQLMNNGRPMNTSLSQKQDQRDHSGNISKIEDEPSQLIIAETEERFLDFPKLPSTPTSNMNSEELIQLGKETFEMFGVEIDDDTILNIKKYRNCVYFNALDRHILWHYTGKFYIGGWSMNSKSPEGEKSGQGIEFFPESNCDAYAEYVYEGEFKEGKRHGEGVMRSMYRDIYTGHWSRGLRHGHGMLKEASGNTYEGEWKEGRKEGFGKQVIGSKDIYEGIFSHGLKQGLGKQLFPNGDRYEGSYKGNKFNGKGAYYWSDGAYYVGDFENGARHGKGLWKSKFDSGDMYEGDYRNDKKCGFGKYTWENGVTYTGSFQNDLRHGEGTIVDEKGASHRAIWSNGIVKNKLYLEEEKKLNERKSKRVSIDVRKKPARDGEDPLLKRRFSVNSSSLLRLDESTNQLSHLTSCLREHPYRDVQQPRPTVENL